MLDEKDMEKIEETFGRYAKIIDEDNQKRLRPVIEMQQEQGKKIDGLTSKFEEQKLENALEHQEVIRKIEEIKKMESEDVQALAGDITIIKRKIGLKAT